MILDRIFWPAAVAALCLAAAAPASAQDWVSLNYQDRVCVRAASRRIYTLQVEKLSPPPEEEPEPGGA